MKWWSVIVALFLALSSARAQGTDDQYIQIYNLIQEADKLNNDRQPGEALPNTQDSRVNAVPARLDRPRGGEQRALSANGVRDPEQVAASPVDLVRSVE